MSTTGRPGERQAALDPAVGVLSNANAVPLDQLSASERSASWRTRFLLREWVAGSLFVIPTLAASPNAVSREDRRRSLSLPLPVADVRLGRDRDGGGQVLVPRTFTARETTRITTA